MRLSSSTAALRLAMPRWITIEHATASTTLANSTSAPSPVVLTMRPWWATGAEMTMVGIIEAAITYGLGLAFAGH